MKIGRTDKLAWEALYKTPLGIEDFEIQVSLRDVSSAVTNLRYFFPLANKLYREKRISEDHRLTLNVLLPKKDGKPIDVGDYSRVCAFLARWNDTPGIDVKIDGRTFRPSDWERSRIFPLCSVSDNGNEYRTLKGSLGGEGGSSSKFSVLAQAIADRLRRIDYKGDRQRPLNSVEKEALRQEVNAELDIHLPEMPVLAQIIWMYMLSELIEGKALYSLSKQKSDIPQIYGNLLSKSRLDAITYGEGMYQLIENSCLHSEGHRAWFGFRMYRAGRDVTMSELSAEARTRTILHDRYKPCFSSINKDGVEFASEINIFNQDYRFYFEFFVVDSAATDAVQIGMVQRYNQEAFRECAKLVVPYFLTEEEKQAGVQIGCPEDIFDQLRWNSAVEAALTKSGREFRENVELLRDLFHLPVRKTDTEAHLQDITVHYGLRLLRRIVSVNNGYLVGQTPDGANKTLCYYNEHLRSDADTQCMDQASYVTAWNVIIPIHAKWPDIRAEQSGGQGQNYLGTKVAAPRETLVYMDHTSVFSDEGFGNKPDSIKAIQNRLELLFHAEYAPSDKSVILLNMEGLRSAEVELLAKALFRQIACANPGGGKVPLRIALLFPNRDILHEFVRWYAVFYVEGKQPDMEGVQLALCGKTGTDAIPSTQLILTGSFLSGARKSAALFVYNHSEGILEPMPLLSYLLQTEADGDGSSEPEAFFPFDLFLPTRIPQGTGTMPLLHLPWQENWFTARISLALNADLRGLKYGCMLNDIHVRLGSKLHLDRFCEAELLFHNMGNIAYFAYLIVQELLYGDMTVRSERPILLLGYEKYSSSLVLQIEYWMRQAIGNLRIYSSIVHDAEADGEVSIQTYFDPQSISYADLEAVQIVTVLPVGTTLSTVYKMHNCARRFIAGKQILETFENNTGAGKVVEEDNKYREDEMPAQPDIAMSFRNFCLVLINGDLFSEDGNLSFTTKRYWNTVERSDHIVTVEVEKPVERSDDTEKRVKYLIPVKAQWIDPMDCRLCKRQGREIRPLIDVKHSETEPDAIFELGAPVVGGFRWMVPNIEVNRNRIHALLHNVHYSHTYFGNNHFQFYIDFETVFRENHRDICQDLRKYVAHRDAYHVLVTPLQFGNSGFIKAITDVVFQGRVKVIRINIADAYREEIRSKFSFVTEDFFRIRRSNPDMPFCVHFADSSIVTGSMLNRARLLVQMLLEQSGISYDDVRLFDRIFLLVNRSSYDSVNFFTGDPQKNLYAYIHLALPSYNTENDQCPACRVTKKYELLEKRSSSERLSAEFGRLEGKHKKRSREEYERWLKESVMTSPSYFAWLVQWLCVNVPEDRAPLCSFIDNPVQTDGEQSSQSEWELYRRDLADAQNVAKTLFHFFRWCRQVEAVQLPSDVTNWDDKSMETYLSGCAGFSILDVVKYVSSNSSIVGWRAEAFENTVLRLVCRQLIDVRDFMRLYSMQRAYEEFDEFRSQTRTHTNYRGRMLKLIASEMRSLSNASNADEYRFLLTRNAEWLISYIKVMSREQLVNYYDWRLAITGIMSDMLSAIEELNRGCRVNCSRIAGSHEELKTWRPIIDAFEAIFLPDASAVSAEGQLYALFQYQIHMILIHRIADLQVTAKISGEGTEFIMTSYHRYLETYFAAFVPVQDESYCWKDLLFEHIVLPTYDKVLIRYLKAAKAATMLSGDAIPSLQLVGTSETLEKLSADAKRPARVRKYLLLCARYIYLENTQLLYTGMRDIEKAICARSRNQDSSNSLEYDFPLEMERLNRRVTKCLQDCYSNLDKEGQEKDIRYQNILGNFCRFWHRSTGEAAAKSETSDSVHVLTYMLHYYRRINNIVKYGKDRIDDLPYLYENLCRTICGITGFQMSYIAYESDGNYPEIFAQSGYCMDLMDHILTPQRAERLLSAYQPFRVNMFNVEIHLRELSGEVLIHNVAVLRDRTYKNDYLILTIPLKNDGSDRFHLIMQSRTDVNIFGSDPSRRNKIALRKARDILFMRQTLLECLARDYTVLINFRFDCSYVRPYGNEGVSAVHISDLHISEPVDELRVKVRQAIEESLSGSTPDLLIVTGDVVDGRIANAPQMEENYRRAKQLLDEIVCSLWKDRTNYLPHDWKRRVIITTGNHDFASMNQYQAAQRRRSLTSAMPVEKDTSTISKFAYFIDFLVSYLDAPVDELLHNDLNEVRYYHKLNLQVLCLNCSGTATSRRTNKMGVNKEKVLELVNRKIWTDASGRRLYHKDGTISFGTLFRLCVAHYSPIYKPIYFLDNYSWMPGWEWDSAQEDDCCINQLAILFRETIQEELRYRVQVKRDDFVLPELPQSLKAKRDALKTEVEAMNGAIEDLKQDRASSSAKGDRYYNRLKAWANGNVSKIVKDMWENDLYSQIALYVEWLNNSNDPSDEQISRLIFEVNESIQMGKWDELKFKDLINEINEVSSQPIDLYLAGHIHAYDEWDSQRPAVRQEKNSDCPVNIRRILIADRLYDKDRPGIHGYLIEGMKASENTPDLSQKQKDFSYRRFGSAISTK